MPKPRVLFVMLAAVILAVTIPVWPSSQVSSQTAGVGPNRILRYNADVAMGRVKAARNRMLVSDGVMATYLEATGQLSAAARAALAQLSSVSSGPAPKSLGCQNLFEATIDGRLVRNKRVNQDCSFRRQAEEFIAINPTNPNNLVAGQNDSVIGFNHCGIDYSFDRGKTWGSMVPPFWQFQLADGHTADAASDPAMVFDSRGNVYFTCILFDVASPASALVIAKSNAAFGGSFFHTPAALSFQEFRTVPLGVVASDNDPNIFHDKEFITADANVGSPKRDNVYVTWTRFSASNSPIYFSQSTDGGATWSPGIAISGSNAALCTVGSVVPNACDQDQGSWPFVDTSGNLYVVFGNANTPLLGINQVLFVTCPVGSNCALPASWSSPTKVGDLIGIHPTGPDANGCPAGRQCLPPNGYRVPEFTSMSGGVSPTTGRILISWADSRNLAANCNPLGASSTATPPCDNDIFFAYSDNGGATWSATFNVSELTGNDNGSAQWQPWSAVGPDGKFYIAYYDRRYGTCETTGCNDITLAVSRNASTAAVPTWNFYRITTASMPNLVPANNPLQAGFLGDYMGIAVDKYGAVIVWGDTRGRNGTVEEDIYFSKYP